MSKRFYMTVVCLGLLYCSTVSAQVGFKMPTYTNTVPGQAVGLPVSVVNFDSVFSIQFVIKWDPAVLEFQSIEHVVNPINIIDSLMFNLNDTANGNIRFLWNSNTYKSLQTGAAIFKLNMKVVGDDGTWTFINFSEIDPATVFEVVNIVNGQNVFTPLDSALLTHGRVNVGIVGSEEPYVSGASNLKIFPNPATAVTPAVTFHLPQSSDVVLRISDMTGRTVFQEVFEGAQGDNTRLLKDAQIPCNGIYYCQIHSGNAVISAPFVVAPAN